MGGWIKLHRTISDNNFWKSEPFTRGQAWVDLLLLANHENGFFYLRDHKINVGRGQVGWSQLKLAKRWKWSRSKTKKFIKDLEKEQQVAQQVSHSMSIITIVNYEKYQEKEQLDVQQKDNRKTTERQQKDINKKNNKNDKNDKKEEEVEFNKFWESYHLTTNKPKTDKDAALKYWHKLNKTERQAAVMNIKKYYDSLDDKKYCKKARTYLSDKNFNDEFKVTIVPQRLELRKLDDLSKIE